MAYAVIGVPLMLLLLSALGTLLANWTKNCYARMRCRTDKNKYQNTAVGYHKTPMSPCKLHEGEKKSKCVFTVFVIVLFLFVS